MFINWLLFFVYISLLEENKLLFEIVLVFICFVLVLLYGVIYLLMVIINKIIIRVDFMVEFMMF